ncbi:MAG TPA: IS3 family transposase [Sphingobacteriaceae bacterium]
MTYSLNSFYKAMGISKQGIHQMLNRRMHGFEVEAYVIKLVGQIRADHPTMSCRAMYYKLKPPHMGRDKFERLCSHLGFTSDRIRNPYRTTDSSGVIRFNNLLMGLKLTHINQAYSSDITYFELAARFYYITFVIDCYSRVILGYSVSNTLSTEQTTLPALAMAVKARGGKIPIGIIFHSDGGGQYYDKSFLAFTKAHQMRNSMCELAYENGKAERINGIIKNNYLKHYQIRNFEELTKSVDRSIRLYNSEKPHKALNYRSPLEFEKQLLLLKQQTEPKMTESLEANSDFWGFEPHKI